MTLFNFIFKKVPSENTWSKIEYFDENWKYRMKAMANFLPENMSIIDLGCGPMWLKEYIKSKKYYPVDYKERGDGTIICDFNKLEFPNVTADYAFVGGCLEYIRDYKWFICQISKHVNNCIISYCCVEHISNLVTRRKLSWVNDLSRKQIVMEFEKNGMTLVKNAITDKNNSIFVFSK